MTLNVEKQENLIADSVRGEDLCNRWQAAESHSRLFCQSVRTKTLHCHLKKILYFGDFIVELLPSLSFEDHCRRLLYMKSRAA